MSYDLDPSKQAQEVVFSRTFTKEDHPHIYFSNIPVTKTTVQKHVGSSLEGKRNYDTHIKEKLS